MSESNRIAVVLTPEGVVDRVVTEAPAEVYVIDESAPDDRVYRLTTNHNVVPGGVAALIAGSPVGELGDRPELETAVREAHGIKRTEH